jgi:hypothetical protein
MVHHPTEGLDRSFAALSKEALDATLASGMESGMRETLDQLDELAAMLSSQASQT